MSIDELRSLDEQICIRVGLNRYRWGLVMTLLHVPYQYEVWVQETD